MNPCRGPKARVTQRYRPPSPGSMSLSSRTAIADGRKKITIANTHSARLAGPIRPAVVSQRSPTIAVMLNSTTSRSVITRGSRLISGGGGMHRGHEPPDAATQRGGRGDVGGEVFVGGDAQRAAPPADPATPSSRTSLALPARASTGWTAQRSMPQRPAGSHGAHGGGPCGRLRPAGSRASRPAPPTVATSPQPAVYAARWAASVDGAGTTKTSSRRTKRNTARTSYVRRPWCAKHHGRGALRFPAPPAKLYRRLPKALEVA